MHVVVASTGSYSDAWAPFHALFLKFWPDCPYPLTLVTDHEPRPWPGDRKIVHGQDHGWCTNLRRALDQIPEERILLLQEDFFLNFPTDTAFVRRALEAMTRDPNIGAFRIYPCPLPEGIINDDYGLLLPGSSYRVSCQATIWRQTELRPILERFNTPREFEIEGTMYANAHRAHIKYVAVREPDPNKWPIQYYCSAIGRGQWDPGAVEFCQRHGVPIDTSARPVASCPR